MFADCFCDAMDICTCDPFGEPPKHVAPPHKLPPRPAARRKKEVTPTQKKRNALRNALAQARSVVFVLEHTLDRGMETGDVDQCLIDMEAAHEALGEARGFCDEEEEAAA